MCTLQDYNNLRESCANRKRHLGDAVRYFAFLRQVDLLSAWLKVSEGTNEESHVESLA